MQVTTHWRGLYVMADVTYERPTWLEQGGTYVDDVSLFTLPDDFEPDAFEDWSIQDRREALIYAWTHDERLSPEHETRILDDQRNTEDIEQALAEAAQEEVCDGL